MNHVLTAFKLQKSRRFRSQESTRTHAISSGSTNTLVIDETHLESVTGPSDFPDGGTKAWCAVFGSFLGLTNCFGTINSTGAIETYIAHNQLNNVSASTVGWIFSIYMFVALMFGVLTGDMFDTRGPRIPIFLGALLTWAGVFGTASCTEIYQFILAFGIVAGLGAAVQSSSLIGIISHYFDKRRGFAFGVATIGASLGGAVFPIMLRALYSKLGFAWAMRIFSFILGFLDIAALLLITPRFAPRSSGQASIKTKIIRSLKKTVDFKALKEPRFLFCCLAVAFSETFLVSSSMYYGSYALSKGNSENTTYLLITINNAMGVVARVAAGYWADKYGKFNVTTVMIFFTSVFCLIVWLPFGDKTAGLYAYSILYGISSAAVLSLTPICLSQVTRVEDFGRKYATCYSVVAVGCLIGIPLSGLFIGSSPTAQNYDNYIIFVSMLGFTAVVCWTVSRWFAVRFKLCIY